MVSFVYSRSWLLLLICCSISWRPATAYLWLENPTIYPRPDELVIVPRSMLEKKCGRIPADHYVIIEQDMRPVLVQYDDRDGDGKWDEIAILQSFEPRERVRLSLRVSPVPATIKASVRAHVRQRRKLPDNTFGDNLKFDSIPAGQPATDFAHQQLPPFLTEGPAWENDKVGFRIYFDVRNGKDIWGKTTSSMVLDEVGADTLANYHRLASWGMDVLKVGQSLGAGALAVQLKDVRGIDTLIRIGGPEMGPVRYEMICDGPVRALFRISYPAIKLPGTTAPASISEEISIWGGQYFYQSTVTANGLPPGAALATGMVNLRSERLHEFQHAKVHGISSFDRQSENNDNLGLGILMPRAEFGSARTVRSRASGIADTYLMSARNNKDIVHYRFYACWERSDQTFTNRQDFESYMVKQVMCYAAPVNVR